MTEKSFTYIASKIYPVVPNGAKSRETYGIKILCEANKTRYGQKTF